MNKALTKKSEYNKRCDVCRKYKKSYITTKKVNGKYLFACKECQQS